MGKVLIVDGSLLDRKRMRTALEAAGHTVIELTSPAHAMHEIPRLKPGTVHLVLTEVAFAEGSGLDLLHWMKQQPHLQSLPVLFVTATPSQQRLIELIRAGASHVVSKPFGREILLRRVTETLVESRSVWPAEWDSVTWQVDDYLRRELKRTERNGASFSALVCRWPVRPVEPGVTELLRGIPPLLRESDVLLRLSDHQVVILLPETDWPGAAIVAGRIAEISPMRIGIGWATFPTEGSDGPSLLRVAVGRAG